MSNTHVPQILMGRILITTQFKGCIQSNTVAKNINKLFTSLGRSVLTTYFNSIRAAKLTVAENRIQITRTWPFAIRTRGKTRQEAILFRATMTNWLFSLGSL